MVSQTFNNLMSVIIISILFTCWWIGVERKRILKKMAELEDAAKQNPPDLLKELRVKEEDEDLDLPNQADDIDIYDALMKLKKNGRMI